MNADSGSLVVELELARKLARALYQKIEKGAKVDAAVIAWQRSVIEGEVEDADNCTP